MSKVEEETNKYVQRWYQEWGLCVVPVQCLPYCTTEPSKGLQKSVFEAASFCEKQPDSSISVSTYEVPLQLEELLRTKSGGEMLILLLGNLIDEF